MASRHPRSGSESRQEPPRQLTLFDLPGSGQEAEASSTNGSDSAGIVSSDEPPSPVGITTDGDSLARQPDTGRTTQTVDNALGPVALRPVATTLRAAIDEYQQYLAAMNRSRHTRASFGLDLRLLLEHLGNAPLHSIGERDLRSFISWVSVQRSNSATSVRRKVATLKNFFAYLRRERAIPTDPAATLIYPEIYPALPEFLEDAQVADLLEAAGEHLFWRALVLLMLDTGLKRDEVVALGRVDVVLSRNSGESYLVVRETEQAKRLRSRRLDLGDDLVAVLLEFIQSQPVRDRFYDVSARGVNFIVETCGKRAHITTRATKLTPQILRATYAVRTMRGMVAQEDAHRAAGTLEQTVAALAEQHDLQLLRLLGLHEEPESAKKYRKLVRGWSAHTGES